MAIDDGGVADLRLPKKKVTMQVDFLVDGNLTTDELKRFMYRRICEFTVENGEGENVQVEVSDYWNSAIVCE